MTQIIYASRPETFITENDMSELTSYVHRRTDRAAVQWWNLQSGLRLDNDATAEGILTYIDRLRNALRAYADEGNWLPPFPPGQPEQMTFWCPRGGSGLAPWTIAQEALAE